LKLELYDEGHRLVDRANILFCRAAQSKLRPSPSFYAAYGHCCHIGTPIKHPCQTGLSRHL